MNTKQQVRHLTAAAKPEPRLPTATPLRVALAILVGTLPLACVTKRLDAATADASAQMSPACVQTIANLRQQCESASDAALEGLTQVLPQQRASLAVSCSDPAGQAAIAELDTCLSQLEARKSAYDAEAESRQSEVQDRVPQVKADPEYQATVEAWKRQRDLVRLQCSDADVRRNVRDANAGAARRECDRMKDGLDDLSADMRGILERHGIDPRDARALGLW
ncbi:MAG: hypothetical protein ACRBN8_42060 [Nannocystales bacterium]